MHRNCGRSCSSKQPCKASREGRAGRRRLWAQTKVARCQIHWVMSGVGGPLRVSGATPPLSSLFGHNLCALCCFNGSSMFHLRRDKVLLHTSVLLFNKKCCFDSTNSSTLLVLSSTCEWILPRSVMEAAGDFGYFCAFCVFPRDCCIHGLHSSLLRKERCVSGAHLDNGLCNDNLGDWYG